MSGWLKQSLLWTAWLCCKIEHKSSVLLFDFLPAAKVDCQAAHTDDGDAPEDFPKDGRSWDVRPAMEGGPVTEGCEVAHSENIWDNHHEGEYI